MGLLNEQQARDQQVQGDQVPVAQGQQPVELEEDGQGEQEREIEPRRRVRQVKSRKIDANTVDPQSRRVLGRQSESFDRWTAASVLRTQYVARPPLMS